MNSPFDVERLRNKLAVKHKLKAFKKTYSGIFPEVRNINTKIFWDNKIINHRTSLKNFPMYADKLSIISRYLSVQEGSLLDLGFGWATLEEKIHKFLKLEIYGIDISKEAVKYAQKHFRGVYKVGSVVDITYPGTKFDFVVALDVLEHIAPSKIFSVYKSVRRVLKKEGRFIVTVPINENLEDLIEKGKNSIGHLRAYTPDIIKAELKIAGFRIEKEASLYAFDRHYIIKKLIVKVLPIKIRRPNLVIIIARKT
jgi:2-polyprenyl-3-methyl-5-hydroxy-6-metoxy-1,4-benzoquinol methylase